MVNEVLKFVSAAVFFPLNMFFLNIHLRGFDVLFSTFPLHLATSLECTRPIYQSLIDMAGRQPRAPARSPRSALSAILIGDKLKVAHIQEQTSSSAV